MQGQWSNHIYTKGCIAALEDWLPRNLYTVAIVFVVISLLQVHKHLWEGTGSLLVCEILKVPSVASQREPSKFELRAQLSHQVVFQLQLVFIQFRIGYGWMLFEQLADCRC